MKSYKHKDKRVHIPSKQEAGYEEANPKVSDNETTELAFNPVIHRGQDPELFWKDMVSLLDREGMAGKVQTIFVDPPYGIKYGGNWQMKLNNLDGKGWKR